MNESKIRAELIDPQLTNAGWGVVSDSWILRERVMFVKLPWLNWLDFQLLMWLIFALLVTHRAGSELHRGKENIGCVALCPPELK